VRLVPVRVRGTRWCGREEEDEAEGVERLGEVVGALAAVWTVEVEARVCVRGRAS